MLKFTTITPSIHLKPLIERYMVVEGVIPQGMVWNHIMIPTMMEFAFFNLNYTPQVFIVEGERVVLEDCILTSQYPSAFTALLSGHVFLLGVQIRNSGIHQLFNMPVSNFPLHSLRLEEIIGKEAGFFCEQLKEAPTISGVVQKLEEFFTRLRRNEIKANGTLLHSLQLIKNARGTNSVRELSHATKTSERMIQKIFLKEVGVSPKEYSKVYRFNQAVQMMMNSSVYSWKKIVENLGYYDQAHFIKDFKDISGQLPSQYFKEYPEAHEAFAKY